MIDDESNEHFPGNSHVSRQDVLEDIEHDPTGGLGAKTDGREFAEPTERASRGDLKEKFGPCEAKPNPGIDHEMKKVPPPSENKRFEAYARAANEDDDGYDPWSDRRPEEPFWEADPWS